ncbi:putative reverse transcriptase domain-containing protein [Tanacetum coccineum]
MMVVVVVSLWQRCGDVGGYSGDGGGERLLPQQVVVVVMNVGRRRGDDDGVKMVLWLTNAPTIFIDLMNWVCKLYLDKFVILFIDDILIYSKSKEDQEVHLRIVLELLKKEKLYAKFFKCEFWLQEVHFLGHVVNDNDIHVDPTKIDVVKNWKAPKSPSKIRSFFGLTSYYRRFIVNFSKIAKPLTSLTQKNKKYE